MFWRSVRQKHGKTGYHMRLLRNENGKDDQNFLNRKIEVGARTGAVQVEWLQDD